MMIIDNMGPEKKQDVVNHHVQNEIMDEPPPYDGPSAGFRAAQASTSRPISTSAPVYQPIQQQCVNHLSLFSRHDAILGTYLVDPRLPAAIGVNSGYRGRRSRSVDKAHARNVRHAFGSVPGGGDDSDHSDTAKWRRRSSRKPEVNAAFRTRHGPIKVNVGIANSALMTASSVDGQRKARGRVMLSSRHGRIHVNLTEIQLGRSADLDVSTRHGNITVFLPPSFDGSVAFRSRRGASGITFLPHFASRARVVRGSDREMLAGDDYCVIGTRHGKVVIGIYGLDTEADAIQSGGLAEQLGALVESGAKQLETWLTAGAKALETSLQARRGAADNARQTRARALSNPLRARSEAIMGASSRKA
ncbi:uncharacterized protein B0H18DRAFT_993783 [Fomitopsis serialis]|uniref:uncharacterized protein n=1 Tax=Fomitopsis serialis TaxID=139415 RepID=UPI002008108E|nr:uncharacterized protein B0H18DRAFT_993783 [Neoantrodia serialis]KAH9930215.1 hypothetical protein B0H18DRAFT_993783 [Neoantrodia serialis]